MVPQRTIQDSTAHLHSSQQSKTPTLKALSPRRLHHATQKHWTESTLWSVVVISCGMDDDNEKDSHTYHAGGQLKMAGANYTLYFFIVAFFKRTTHI